jgi:hypothetical protein
MWSMAKFPSQDFVDSFGLEEIEPGTDPQEITGITGVTGALVGKPVGVYGNKRLLVDSFPSNPFSPDYKDDILARYGKDHQVPFVMPPNGDVPGEPAPTLPE